MPQQCNYCGEELTFITKDKNDSSNFYRCKNCNTTWNVITDNSLNRDILVDVDQYLEELHYKRIAS